MTQTIDDLKTAFAGESQANQMTSGQCAIRLKLVNPANVARSAATQPSALL
jgi:rubrerythrin